MSARQTALILNDVRLQYRYGIYLAYGVVIAMYVAVIIFGRAYLPTWGPALIIFTDPAALGFFFLGALMMLEKAELVRTALATAPLSAAEYLIAKTVTLCGMTLISCGVLLVALHDSPNPILLLVTVALTSIHFIGIGVPIALRFKTVNGYLIGSAGFLTPIIAPGFVALLETMPLWFAVIPAASQFRLILVAMGGATATLPEIAVMLGVCGLAAGGAMALALHFLKQEFGR